MSPQDIVIDSSNNVYVADQGNNRVQKFGGNGNFITKWGYNGTADGLFSSPIGLSVDSSGNVYVSDTDNNRIQVFAPSTNN